jgi:hypothetical protein
MKSNVPMAAFFLILLSALVPARADIIADQSLISVSAPLAPSLDQIKCADGTGL